MHRNHTIVRLFLLVLLIGVASLPATLRAATGQATTLQDTAAAPTECVSLTSLFLPLVQGAGATGVAPLGDEPPTDDDEGTSNAVITVTGASTSTFNSGVSTLTFDVTCPGFTENPEDVTVTVNETLVYSDSFVLEAQRLTVSGVWEDGRNDVQLVTNDADGAPVSASIVFWAGFQTLDVMIEDEFGHPVAGATVTATLGDDQNVNATATSDANGLVTFQNLPDRTIILEARTANNDYGTLGVIPSAGAATLMVRGFNEASPIDNNDFSLGLEGWDIGDAPVQLIPHEEELTDGTTRSGEDMDLQLSTSGQGPVHISRTFEVEPGATNVKVRYRFITEEVPGGYYGTQWNDYFSVSIRSLRGGASAEANSMNALGLGAFDFAGRTGWREENLAVDEEGDTIQVDLVVANVDDDLFDSHVIIDMVIEEPLRISALALYDIDNSALGYLSAAEHTYFSGNTRVHGTITIEGPEDATIDSVELEVVQNGGVVARGELVDALSGTLLQTLGSDKKVSVTNRQLMFEIPSAQLAGIDSSANGTLTLRVRARSTDGEEALREFGSVQILARYTNANRYGGRDPNRGGDDWVQPDVKTIVEHFGTITVGDFSNMNAGDFTPDHETHQQGIDVDGWYAGYNAIDAGTAATMINLLNDPTYGSNITRVFVSHQRVNGQPFWDAIRNVVLDDGRRARDVIRHVGGHGTHFHWVITP